MGGRRQGTGDRGQGTGDRGQGTGRVLVIVGGIEILIPTIRASGPIPPGSHILMLFLSFLFRGFHR